MRMISVPFSKAFFPMCVTLFGILTDLSESHSQNAQSPMLVTLSGITIEVSDLHPKNAIFPILSTLFGIEIDLMELHSANAPSPMSVTPSGITTVSECPRYFCSTPSLMIKSCVFILESYLMILV